MLKRLILPLGALVLALVVNFPASAKDAPEHDPYFPLATIDFKALLPAPPVAKSDVEKNELDGIVQSQKSLTQAQLDHIHLEANYDTYHIFEDVVGGWFTKNEVSKLPDLQRLLKREADTTVLLTVAGKDYWKRLRPFLEDPRVHSQIGPVDGWAYPSGHSTRATVEANVLAQLDPVASDALLKRGLRVGDDRVLAGVHYPSDVAAGRTLGKAIFDQLVANPDFQADLAKAKVEVAGEMQKAK